jgi:3-(3-hydroxy-phenyl)propionate hydroxylase
MADGEDCDVVIIGAGPVGVTLALLLARQGVRVIAAEREPDIYPLPRAAHIDHEIVRIFQALGVADEIMATSRVARRYDFLTAGAELLLRFEMGAARTPSGWPASNMIHQPSIEGALRRALSRTASASLRSEWKFGGLEPSGEGVAAHFSTPDGPRTVRARYLVGCDGARSAVREARAIRFEDLAFDEPWLVIDAIVHDSARLPDVNLQICDPARPTTCVLMGEGRHRWEFMMKPDETPEQVTDDAFIAALLRPWDVEGAVTVERKAVYRFHALVADRWRDGPVLIAGDAAHQMPPFAGQGLCSGVRDAANLAWKLADIITRGARDALLDTYQPEREPNVRAIIDMALLMGRTVCIMDPVAAAARDARMLAERADGRAPGAAIHYPALRTGCILAGAPGAGEYFPQPWASGDHAPVRLDDALGDGAWLISRDAAAFAPPAGLVCASLADAPMAPFAADLRVWLARRGADAVLVRPDRYVFGAGSPDALISAWREARGADRVGGAPRPLAQGIAAANSAGAPTRRP